MELPQDIEHDLVQEAFSSYLDATLGKARGHDRQVVGILAVVRTVADRLEANGYVRAPRGPAVHGTHTGYGYGCRCEFCTTANAAVSAALKYWTAQQGHNKVSPLTRSV